MEEKKYLDYEGLQTYHTNLCNIIEDNEQITAAALDNLDDRLKDIETENPYSKLEIDDLLEPITDKLNDIEEFAEVNVQSDWNQTDTNADDYIKNKPTIPSVGDAEVEIQKNGTKVGSFTTNLSGSKVTVNIAVPTGTAANKDVPTSGNASTSQVVMGNDSRLTDSRNAKDVYSWAKASSKPTYTASEVGAIPTSAKGAASGVATLDSAGKVPSSQLPSYVDDVLEYDTKSAFPTTGEGGKIYIDKSNNTTWRWSGSSYTQIKGDLTIGTTSGTAADGKVVNDHINNTSNPHGVTKAQVGLGRVVNTGDSATPVSGGTTKFTTGGAYTELNKKVDKVSGKGLSTNDYTTDEKNKLSGIASGANKYTLPTASANTLGGVKVGDGLSIDNNGVLSAQASAEIYTKQQQDGKFIVIKDLNAAPTESTLTYTENGTVKNFKQGDEIRVPDAEADNGYTFYKLYALTIEGGVTTATWDKLGAGSGGGGDVSDYFEKAVISLAQVGGDNEDIIGATITVLNNDNNTTIGTYTWNGSPVTCTISHNINYSIILSSIEGYIASPSKNYISQLNNRREITCYYNSDLGVYIEATDGGIYNDLNWDTNKTPNALLLFTESIKVRIAFETPTKPIHNATSGNIANYLTGLGMGDMTSGAEMFNKRAADIDGAYNTQQLIAFNTANGINNTNYAAPYAINYTFPNGNKNGYVASIGQCIIIRENLAKINSLLDLLNISEFTGNYTSSSFGGRFQSESKAWDHMVQIENIQNSERLWVSTSYGYNGLNAQYKFFILSNFN